MDFLAMPCWRRPVGAASSTLSRQSATAVADHMQFATPGALLRGLHAAQGHSGRASRYPTSLKESQFAAMFIMFESADACRSLPATKVGNQPTEGQRQCAIK